MLMASAPFLTSAFAFVVPRIPADLPPGTASLALDDETGLLIAYDANGKTLGDVAPDNSPEKRQDAVGACSPLSADDVQKRKSTYGEPYSAYRVSVPGWEKLEQKANDDWGDGSRNIVTNPEDVS